ncbi:hypothetical protein [uncultured Lacinutrix sp.]|uniref:hypothetical protein n=1 Tax=uncultured Lacinutrix sp. TaxID=574032 RepID=UPI00262AB673|nr:hypothetical protein [uncultured Lacinutrix sp.]
MTDKEQKYYKRIKSSFIGQTIKEVYYEELDYDTDSEFWEISDEIHSVDMNVIFRLDNDQLLQIKWDNEFYCYGIGFENLPEIIKREGFKTINVSNNSNWKKFIDKAISGIKVLWDISEGVTSTYSENRIIKKENSITKLPQTWELSFDNEKVWISALEIDGEKRANFWADHLSVIFTNHEQEKYQLIEKASTQHGI